MDLDGKLHVKKILRAGTATSAAFTAMPQTSTLGKTMELYTDDWLSIIDKLREACIPQLTFTGGEPTLRSTWLSLSPTPPGSSPA
jgi:hypothetical protein